MAEGEAGQLAGQLVGRADRTPDERRQGPPADASPNLVGKLRESADASPPTGDAVPAWRLHRADQAVDDQLLQCLVALTALLDRPASADVLTAGLPLGSEGMTPELCVRAAARAGLAGRIVARDVSEIDVGLLPCILLFKDRHAAVLSAVDAEGRAVLIRPETGRGEQRIPLADVAERYSGYAIFMRPQHTEEKRVREVEDEFRGHWFWSAIKEQWPALAEVALASVLINSFALASPLFVMNVYDRVVPNGAIDTLWVLAIGAFTVFGFDFLLKTLRGYFIDTAGRRTDLTLASRIFEHVLSIRMASRPPSAGAFANYLREFETLRDFFTSATVTTLIDLPFLFFFIFIIYLIGGPVAIIPAIAVPVVIGIGLALQIPLNKIVRRTAREAAQKHGVLVETINGLETIKTIGAEGRLQRSWEGFVAATSQSSNQARLLSSITVNVAALAANLVTVGVVIVGVYQITEGNMTVGALVAATIIAGRAMAPLGQVAGILTRFHQAKTSYEILDKVMAMETERPPGQRFLHRAKLKGAISFRNVSLTYPNQKLPAVSELNFHIEPGEKVGLIGRIGSGKTTIEKLILGLYEPQEGAVLVDGTDIRQLDPADLRRSIGCVPQDVFLFHGTVRENITMGAPFADDAAILRAAQIAGVDAFVSRHPMGYDMNVGERGEMLSGGQRQAIAVARALLLDPPILILDEPTSAMDNGSEARLKARLAEEMAGRTMLLVTHRASLLSLVSRVLVMDNGRVVADGPRDKVLQALAAGKIKGGA